mmetsp:Transcript_131672/g.328330  ORF Transcript_131672/g.328330 Transcript_131672/m.328330 type:complete len:227 (-) Transcript_131672:305-985(-)
MSPPQMPSSPAESVDARSALVESVEERLFHALRREVFPFVQARERTAIRREIWMLEEELGCGHPFFSSEQQGVARDRADTTVRHKILKKKTMGLVEGAPMLAAGAAFETDAAHALGVPKCDFPGLEETDSEEECETDSRCSTKAPSPGDEMAGPSPMPSPPNFWLPVLKRCLTQEQDMAVRTRLVSEISDLEEAIRLPSGHDLGSCEAPPSCGRSMKARSMTWSAC